MSSNSQLTIKKSLPLRYVGKHSVEACIVSSTSDGHRSYTRQESQVALLQTRLLGETWRVIAHTKLAEALVDPVLQLEHVAYLDATSMIGGHEYVETRYGSVVETS
jgi:hypothetical protein